jgi:hypothetical protein
MATEKQKRAIKNVVENGGTVSKAMREAGYSPNTAHTPKKLTESDAWRELMDNSSRRSPGREARGAPQ